MNINAKKELDLLLDRYPQLKKSYSEIEKATKIIIDCFSLNQKLLVCGNGGSAADSLHIVGELQKGFVKKRKVSKKRQEAFKQIIPEYADYYINNLQQGLSAISLVSEVGLTTAYTNDNTADLVFAQQVLAHGSKNDVLLAITTSGNSMNIVHAINVAKSLGLTVIGLTGRDGGKIKDVCDCLIIAPEKETYRIQELHLPIYHSICLAVEKEFFTE